VPNSRALDSLTAEDFRPYLGTRFCMGGDSFDLELVSIVELGAAISREFRAPFSLMLRGPLEPLLKQRIHRLEHRELGVLDLFLVPIGPDQTGMGYEAVFG
jgi:hypothetical protein